MSSPSNANVPGIGLDQAVDHAQQRSTCRRPRGRREAQNSPLGDLERHVVDRDPAAIALVDVLEGDHAPTPASREREEAERDIGDERDEDDRERTEEDEVGRRLAEPEEDEAAEAAGADQRRDHGEADRLHGDDAEAGEEHRQRQRDARRA